MAGGEPLDKRVDWVAVTKEYLNELYDKVAGQAQQIAALTNEVDLLTHETEELEDRIGTLLYELGELRISGRSKPAIYRKKKAA